MEKLGLILNFAGTLVIWIDAFVLSSYITPNQIILRADSGYKIIISKFFLHVGLLLVLAGFLLQLLAYDTDRGDRDEPKGPAQENRDQTKFHSHNIINPITSKSQSPIVPQPPSTP